jgi:hypothetical protein
MAEYIYRKFADGKSWYCMQLDGPLTLSLGREEGPRGEGLTQENVPESVIEDFVSKARAEAAKMQASVSRVMDYESAGLTYAEVHFKMTGEKSMKVSENTFHASEDLAFLYMELGRLWRFINEAEYLMQYPDETGY